MVKTKRRKPMLLSKCAVRGSEKSRFIKEQEASGLLLEPNLRLKNIIIGDYILKI